MEYKTNTHYPLSELNNINDWWQDHKEYDINEYQDYCEIVERADNGAPTIIRELKSYLNSTDYIIAKLQEAFITDQNEYQQLLNEYADVIEKRKQARARINELEQ